MDSPERVERAIEDGQLLVPVDQQRAARVIDVLTVADVDVLQLIGDVEQTPRVHVETKAAEQPAED